MFRDSTGKMDSETPENGSLRLCTLGESVKIGGIEPEGYLAHVTPTPNGNRNKGIPISKPADPISRRVSHTETHNGSRKSKGGRHEQR